MRDRISDDPEGFIVQWLRDRAQDIEDGLYSLERFTQTWPDDDLYVFTVELGRPRLRSGETLAGRIYFDDGKEQGE